MCFVVILSDKSIREALAAKRIVIDPLDESCLQPSSIDVKVSNLFRVFRNHTAAVIDVKKDLADLNELLEVPQDGVFMLHPGEFVLGSTLERVAIADDLVARVEGKSSLGRLGLLIHSTAGFIDAGFDGHITLELSNVANLPITLYPNMKIGQVSFMTMTTHLANLHVWIQREDWPSEFHDNDNSGRQSVRQGCTWLKISGSARADPKSLLRKLSEVMRGE